MPGPDERRLAPNCFAVLGEPAGPAWSTYRQGAEYIANQLGGTIVPMTEQENDTMGRPKGSQNKKKTTANGRPPADRQGRMKLGQGVQRGPKFTKDLQVKARHDELDVQSKELAALWREREAVLEQRTVAMKGFRERLTGIDERAKILAESVETGSKLVPVECVRLLYAADRTIRTVRLDTKEELECRDATAEDLQESLPSDKPPKAKPAAREPEGDDPDDDFDTGDPAQEGDQP